MRYGRLVIIKDSIPKIYKGIPHRTVTCVCDCGNIKDIALGSLKSGLTTSCGCFGKEQRLKASTKHGYATNGVSSIYNRWYKMIERCNNPKNFDYKDYGEGTWTKPRFAVVYHFLSIKHNHRIRVKTFSKEEDFPLFPSVIDLWPVANWYEREAFDLFGFMFTDHPDLRRILTDYGFVGYPFRKDFPMIGKVEVRYDDAQKRVIYQPVSIEERNNVPRIIREEGFHNG